MGSNENDLKKINSSIQRLSWWPMPFLVLIVVGASIRWGTPGFAGGVLVAALAAGAFYLLRRPLVARRSALLDAQPSDPEVGL